MSVISLRGDLKVKVLAVLSAFLMAVVVFAPSAAFASDGIVEVTDEGITALSDEAVAKEQTYTTAAKKKTKFTITPKSKPYDKKILKYTTYNKQLKQYWCIKSYMDLFEKRGGGTLVFKKGTYNIPISIFVPSNVTFIFQKGVVLNKTKTTGTKKVSSNGQLFQFIAPSKAKKKAAVRGYNGSKNISFIGKGNVTFNMKKVKGVAIAMCHNQNVQFQNITFKNGIMHFIELDASDDVTFSKCKFMNLKGGKTNEAINLDTPDAATGGFSFKWAAKDKMPNKNVTIDHCTFTNCQRCIGTHKYSQFSDGTNSMHTNVSITNNTFNGFGGYEGGLVCYNWQDVTIANNTFVGSGATSKTYGVVGHSVVNCNIYNNSFSKVETPILLRRGFTSSGYAAPAELSLTSENISNLVKNSYVASTVTNGYAYVTQLSAYATPKKDRVLYDLIAA